MRIVQEAFGGWQGGDASHPFLPHQHVRDCLAYSSTHDSDTGLSWWHTAPPATRAFAAEYLQAGGPAGSGSGHDIPLALIRAASRSVANLALFPMQDVLGLDGSHRMNLVAVFVALCSQWRMAPTGGIVGLEYGSIEPVLRLLGVPRKAWGKLFEDLRVLERAAVQELRR